VEGTCGEAEASQTGMLEGGTEVELTDVVTRFRGPEASPGVESGSNGGGREGPEQMARQGVMEGDVEMDGMGGRSATSETGGCEGDGSMEDDGGE